jgi:hypothetical protein
MSLPNMPFEKTKSIKDNVPDYSLFIYSSEEELTKCELSEKNEVFYEQQQVYTKNGYQPYTRVLPLNEKQFNELLYLGGLSKACKAGERLIHWANKRKPSNIISVSTDPLSCKDRLLDTIYGLTM